MHKTKGNMSGQHRRQKHLKRPHQHFHDAPNVTRYFWKLFWKPVSAMTDAQLKWWLVDVESHVAFYCDPAHRDKGRRTSWVRERRDTWAEMEKRGMKVEKPQ